MDYWLTEVRVSIRKWTSIYDGSHIKDSNLMSDTEGNFTTKQGHTGNLIA